MYRFDKKSIDRLLSWYRENRRDLPWRKDRDPYAIWLSEIMLQQTRVEAVISYYERFRKQYPDVESLAKADEETLLRLWEGLGYYSRVRNMKKCAQVLMERYNGTLPENKEEMMKLPGIGSYTAGAVSAIAYGLPEAAVDGNVLRVLARLFAIRDDIRDLKLKKKLEKTITDFYQKNMISDPEYISDLTQALMELGATVCLPSGRPLCEKCPFSSDCKACRESLTDVIPFRSRDRDRRIVDRTLFVIRHEDDFLLHRRPSEGLLAGMYEFIGIDRKLNREEALHHLKDMGIEAKELNALPPSRHVFTHLEWRMEAYEILVEELPEFDRSEYILTDRHQLQSLAVPSAFRTYLNHYGLRKGDKQK
ncbi:MAG: A/G-specific adenine glycosylase [Erysipelotrichaceae bacterium]|nr:A/G-specific adenine glycosylase [Erysipelotrichaceae bacterium]